MPRGSFVVLAFNLPIFMNYCNVVQGPRGAEVDEAVAVAVGGKLLELFCSATICICNSKRGRQAAAASLSAKFRQHQRP